MDFYSPRTASGLGASHPILGTVVVDVDGTVPDRHTVALCVVCGGQTDGIFPSLSFLFLVLGSGSCTLCALVDDSVLSIPWIALSKKVKSSPTSWPDFVRRGAAS